MSKDIRISVDPTMYLLQFKDMQKELEEKERQIAELSEKLKLIQEPAVSAVKGKTNLKIENKTDIDDLCKSYSEFKSDGVRKAHAADSIRSYDDFCAIANYFLERGQIRNWAMWMIGVSLGLRVSDLLSLKFKNLIEDDKKTIRKRILIYEKKTGKLNNLLITESVKYALGRYLEAIKGAFDLEGFLFPSQKTKGKMYEECGWRILSSAGKALKLPLVIGSHTMRKSFANIAACVDRSSVDMNSIAKVQGLLNHSDQRVTMSYLGTYRDMYDRARIAVSDFVLGKTNVNEIVAGNQYTTEDIMCRLESLEKLIEKGNANE